MDNPHGHGPPSEWVAKRIAKSRWWVYYGTPLDIGTRAIIEVVDREMAQRLQTEEDAAEGFPFRYVYIPLSTAQALSAEQLQDLSEELYDMTDEEFGQLVADGFLLPLHTSASS